MLKKYAFKIRKYSGFFPGKSGIFRKLWFGRAAQLRMMGKLPRSVLAKRPICYAKESSQAGKKWTSLNLRVSLPREQNGPESKNFRFSTFGNIFHMVRKSGAVIILGFSPDFCRLAKLATYSRTIYKENEDEYSYFSLQIARILWGEWSGHKMYKCPAELPRKSWFFRRTHKQKTPCIQSILKQITIHCARLEEK